MSQTAAHTDMLVYQGVKLSGACRGKEEEGISEGEADGPGKGNVESGSKAAYAKRTAARLYDNIRLLDPDVGLFEKTVHLSRDEFDDLHGLVCGELQNAMDVRREHAGEFRASRRRRLNREEILFMFLDILGGSNEGGIGIERVGHRYGVSIGTVSNYFRHVLLAVFKYLDAIEPRLIRRPDAAERGFMEGLLLGFPRCIFFVDGNKNKRWRPGENQEQERAYDEYKKAHVWSVLVFCDLYGRFIRLEISDKGAESDRNMYKSSEVYHNLSDFLAAGKHGMADMGFGGSGGLVVPYKRNESTEWIHRSSYNRYIRQQRMVNEWGIGYINNRFRIFLGRWPLKKELLPIDYNTAAMLSDWQFDRRGFALPPRWRYEEKLAAHGRIEDYE